MCAYVTVIFGRASRFRLGFWTRMRSRSRSRLWWGAVMRSRAWLRSWPRFDSRSRRGARRLRQSWSQSRVRSLMWPPSRLCGR
jgi:hypothetical protein